MGNHSSKRKSRGLKCRYRNPDDELSEDEQIPEDFEGTTPSSYDKLLAWMVEMAENDDADISSPAFIEHLTTQCAEKVHQSTAQLAPSTRSIPSKRQNSLDVPIRQHSLDSSNGSRYSRSSRSREDLLHPKTRFRRAMLSRQSTVDFSDDSDSPRDPMGAGSFDSDTETNYLSPETILINDIGETSFTNRFRPPLRKNQSCTTYRNYNTSIADLLNVGSRKKSKSLMTMRKMLSETRNDEEIITPITEETVVKVLDDDILDRNMADILYSVEALWPKPPKYLSQEHKGYSFS
ncbi:uncharacterized protein LOC132714686 [Ruditapes philippinarum]|uniref:uncharacterized protein LOC132714686 n=1 Tax=Ruditapes philippinarum TaxID=129788 RepID=UPI00295A9C9B|nr:uncharacterized protein LOC132714686 [Ruditapes philippinarum]